LSLARPLPELGTLAPEDRGALARAWRHLERPGFAARLTSVVGTPIEQGLELLPADWSDRLHRRLEKVLVRALETSIRSLGREESSHTSSQGFHTAAGIGSGVVGGLLGLPGLLFDLPVSTMIMLRSIAAIARDEGEDLDSVEARLSCLTVFAYGARSHDDDAADTGYYGVRLALALALRNASRHIAARGLARESAPALVRLLAAISSRFGVTVTEKAAAMSVPLVGAAGGAAVNTLFIRHFQEVARAHFTVRRLERRYGRELIRREYETIGSRSKPGARLLAEAAEADEQKIA
jgi:hypothetical protein